MKTAVLVVNPGAGRAGLLRAHAAAMEATLRRGGYEPSWLETTRCLAETRRRVWQAAARAALVIACGGDGTVHAALQGVVHGEAALGVVPLGTANALARNLRLPLDPLRALERLLGYEPRCIPAGELVTATETRYFTLMAGCGPDGALAHRLADERSAAAKRRFGRATYYAQAAQLVFSRFWPRFKVELRTETRWTELEAVSVMVSRVPDLGGLFSGLTPGSDLEDPRLRVQVLRAPAHLSMPAWMLAGALGRGNPWLRMFEVDEVRCSALDGRTIHAQADAEPMGGLPIALRLVPNALRLLMPALQ